MEHFSSAMDLPVSEMQMKMKSQYFTVSNEQMSMVEPLSSNPEFEHLIPHNQVGHITESSGGSVSSNPMWNQLGREDANILNQVNSSLPVKRKAEVGPLLNNSISQPWLLPSKRPAHMEAGSSFQQSSASERKSGQAYSKLGSQGLQDQSLLNKKMNRNESMPGKSGIQRGQSAKKQVTQIGSASKARPESSGAVRSKMRESLAAALALAFPRTLDVSNPEKDQVIATTADLVPAVSQASCPNSTAGGLVPGSDKMFHPNESALIGKTNDFQVSSAEPSNESSANGDRIFQEFQYSLPDEDASFSNQFFNKDDLLHVNGLSWAFEFDAQMMQGKEAQDSGTPHSVNFKQEDPGHRDRKVDQNLTPVNLASEIEAELYKLHGGVNKKYKEKGRSLLFNLKDRSNPELRERVMSGEISPEKLCSMSAEELASKELSQWRMAKAEEFAQMVVLPDTEVDIRRLVRKTHKGEFQVEVEHDDGIVAEVSGGTSMLTRPLPQKEKLETHYSPEASTKDTENIAGQENIVENQEFSGSLIIPTDGTDLMQGIIVDELKDPNFLPPIVSLDEFMESLDAEPPFPNLSADSGVKTPLSDDRSPKALNKTLASDRASDSPREAPSKKGDVKKSEVMPFKLSGSPTMQKVLPSTSSKAAYIWEGNLELTTSSSITVSGLFQSGEKTSTKEWPKSLEIKGRVRLDAFEKFLQELPKSRTRAVMVLQFVVKDKSSEIERSNFSEAVDSFAEDERLGYAEPVSAVELYLCPPTRRITDILKKLMAKEANNSSIENGLIGVVVWRRAHISNTISPNSSSHHKHSTKKQPFAPPKRVQDSSNVNANNRTPLPRVPQSQPQPQPHPHPHPQPVPDEDDDVPPGFGPAANAAKDDDDLPEFNFSGDINPYHVRAPQRPVDKVRELIQKYGQSGTSPSPSLVDNRTLGGIVPWNDDEDDDIPEWRPQAPPQLHHQSYPVVVPGHIPSIHVPPTNQHMAQTPIRGVVQPPLGSGRWVQPPGPLHGTRWRHH